MIETSEAKVRLKLISIPLRYLYAFFLLTLITANWITWRKTLTEAVVSNTLTQAQYTYSFIIRHDNYHKRKVFSLNYFHYKCEKIDYNRSNLSHCFTNKYLILTLPRDKWTRVKKATQLYLMGIRYCFIVEKAG